MQKVEITKGSEIQHVFFTHLVMYCDSYFVCFGLSLLSQNYHWIDILHNPLLDELEKVCPYLTYCKIAFPEKIFKSVKYDLP